MLICCVNVLQQEALANWRASQFPLTIQAAGGVLCRWKTGNTISILSRLTPKVMQSGSSVPEGPRHWIKIKPLSLFLLLWGHWEGKDVINRAINLIPEASSLGFLPCSSSVMQGRGWHPGLIVPAWNGMAPRTLCPWTEGMAPRTLCPWLEGVSPDSSVCPEGILMGTVQGFMGSSTGCCPSLKSIPLFSLCCCYQELQSPSHSAFHGSLPHKQLEAAQTSKLYPSAPQPPFLLKTAGFSSPPHFSDIPGSLPMRMEEAQVLSFLFLKLGGFLLPWWRAQIVN